MTRFKVTVDVRSLRSQGPRFTMEDRHCIKTICNGKLLVLGVFDGHGGYEVAEMCALETPTILESIIKQNPDMSECLRLLYKALDEKALTLNKQTGCTAAIALITPDRVWFSNCGDALITLKRRNGTLQYMSQDHKVENEIDRLKAQGGVVTYIGGCARIYGTLNIARSIGDHFLKSFVINDPYVTSTTFPKSEIDWIMIASDGLWDVYNPTQLSSDLIEYNNTLSKLMDRTYERGSMDNVTMIFAEFHKVIVEDS